MPKPALVRVPLKFFGEARKTVRAQFAATRISMPAVTGAVDAGPAPRGGATERPGGHERVFSHPSSILGRTSEFAAVLYDDAAPPEERGALQETPQTDALPAFRIRKSYRCGEKV